jgi:hypothetical protein
LFLSFLLSFFLFFHFFPIDKNKYCIVLRLDDCPLFYNLKTLLTNICFNDLLQINLIKFRRYLQKTLKNNDSIDVMLNQFWKKPKYHRMIYIFEKDRCINYFRSRFSCFFFTCFFLLEMKMILFEWYQIGASPTKHTQYKLYNSSLSCFPI